MKVLINSRLVTALDGHQFTVFEVTGGFAPKAEVERTLGHTITNDEYDQHCIDRTIGDGCVNARFVEVPDTFLINNRDIRESWCDVTPEAIIDIDCTKAKQISLDKLRAARNKKLDESDKEFFKALETGIGIDKIKADRQALRDITEPLKALNTEGKINCEKTLKTIRQLMVLK